MKIRKQIAKMNQHMIICGLGEVGTKIAEEFLATQTPFVAIENDHRKLRKAYKKLGHHFLFLEADPEQDITLLDAGIEKARGLAATSDNDHENLFITISARTLNPDLQIISLSYEDNTWEKLKKAGANEVIGPNQIGGLRVASVMIRPQVVNFLDKMLRGSTAIRFEEMEISNQSQLKSKTLSQSFDPKKLPVSLVALLRGEEYIHANLWNEKLRVGDRLVLIGEPEAVGGFQEKYQ